MIRTWDVDFTRLVEELDRPQTRKGPQDLSIFGGRCPEEKIGEFLAAWDLGVMPYRLWEYVSRIEFTRDSLPEDVYLLERGRLFGQGGDLSLRRLGGEFAWRFIGPAGIHPPVTAYRNYWDEDAHKEVRFLEHEKTVLLWGKAQGERWIEERVAAARLDYPKEGKRLALKYKAFSRAGQVEFVWYTELAEWEGAGNE